MEFAPKSPDSVQKQPITFSEHQGIETDLTGCRSWNSWYQDKQYALWEINYESQDNPNAILPYYRLNWRPYGSTGYPLQHNPWYTLGDFDDFESAMNAAQFHASKGDQL